MKVTQTPVTTTTSVVGLHFKDGVIITADIGGYYGSLARYRHIERLLKINNNVLLGAGGDIADYQYIKNLIDRKILSEKCIDDGFELKPRSLHSWLTRVMYKKRSNFDPLWNNFLIAGIEDGKPYLGTVDKLGTAFIDPVIATGYGAHMATPLLRSAYDANNQMTEQEATDVLHKAMRTLYYRDARSSHKYYVGVVTKERGVEIKGPIEIDTNWDTAVALEGCN